LASQRWYAGSGEPTVANTDRIALGTDLDAVIVTTEDGDRYHLIQTDAQPDRADQPAAATALARLVAEGASARGPGGAVRSRWIGGPIGRGASRSLGAEQSNTSMAVGGTHLVKVLRRLRPGAHPEVEIGCHLAGTDAPVPALAGWWEWEATDGTTSVLGTVHELIGGALDGWALTLAALAADPDTHLRRLHELGTTVADLHRALAQPGEGFGTSVGDGHQLWALADRVLEDPALPPAGHQLVAHAVNSIGTDLGAAIRTHGDLHLGQTLHGSDGWRIIDFEGEPDRALEERRQRSSPLRDVAGMLRSLHYATATASRVAGGRSGDHPPSSWRPGWLPAARAAFLDGYLAAVGPALVPTSAVATRELLALFELEKVLYELRYEERHRPDWAAIPSQGLAELIGSSTTGEED
jgi:maltokinase